MKHGVHPQKKKLKYESTRNCCGFVYVVWMGDNRQMKNIRDARDARPVGKKIEEENQE